MSPRREPQPAVVPLPTELEVAEWHRQGRIASAVTYPIPPLRDPDGSVALDALLEVSASSPVWSSPAPRAGVQLRAGSRLMGTVTGPTVIGRMPTMTGVTTIAVDDTDRSVSRNHLRLELDARGTVIACDLGSANGTEQIGVDGNRTTFAPGKWYPVSSGDTLILGELALDVV